MKNSALHHKTKGYIVVTNKGGTLPAVVSSDCSAIKLISVDHSCRAGVSGVLDRG
jgi:hypothetical protein